MNELSKILQKMGVQMTLKPILATPARGFDTSARLWRVTFTRKVGRGKDASELRFSTPFLEESPVVDETPQASDVIECLIRDVHAGESTYWDFSQSHGRDRPTEEIEALHEGCKRIGRRIKRFFGDTWTTIDNVGSDKPPMAKSNTNRPPAIKSA